VHKSDEVGLVQLACSGANQHEVWALQLFSTGDLGQRLLGDKEGGHELATGLVFLAGGDLEARLLKDKVLVSVVDDKGGGVNGDHNTLEKNLGVHHGVGVVRAADVLLAGSTQSAARRHKV
jgi:hypothetical protein